MICRLWRGWAEADKADVYEQIVRRQVIPAIEQRQLAGFIEIDLMRREVEREVEFATIMWFDSLEAVQAFAGEDYRRSHVPAAARDVLCRWDEIAIHFEVLDRRQQASVTDISWRGTSTSDDAGAGREDRCT